VANSIIFERILLSLALMATLFAGYIVFHGVNEYDSVLLVLASLSGAVFLYASELVAKEEQKINN
jgi:archaellum biogenesis protein FlaJ (TadC family)